MENGEWRMRKENILREKSFAFAIRIVKLYKYLTGEQKEFVLAKQIARSGTAIGALIRESENAVSKKDFIHKLTLALKEADETVYWLELLKEGDYIELKIYASLVSDCNELIKLLVASVKTSKLHVT
jgi:four helix bundle protein